MSALAHLESLLRAKKLDLTLTSSAPWHRGAEDRASTGVPAIDRAIGGGLARGQLSEIVGPRSAGRTTLLCHTLATAAARGEAVALVDPNDRFDPGSASAIGVDLSRLLWVRGMGDAASALTALKAMNLILQAGNFGVVALDLADVPAAAMRAFPFTTWLRMSRVIEGSQTVALLVGADRLARSAGGVTITLDRPSSLGHVAWSGTSDRARLLGGIALHPRIISAR
jgi:DNA-binding transcriptional regulator YdaS (Cro superfamily)